MSDISINSDIKKKLSESFADDENCHICLCKLDYFSKKDTLVIFPIEKSECKCNFIIHEKCLLEWCNNKCGNYCPVCLQTFNKYTNNNKIINLTDDVVNNPITNIESASETSIVIHNNDFVSHQNLSYLENRVENYNQINGDYFACYLVCFFIFILLIFGIVIIEIS